MLAVACAAFLIIQLQCQTFASSVLSWQEDQWQSIDVATEHKDSERQFVSVFQTSSKRLNHGARA